MNVHKNAKLTPLGREQIIKRKAAGKRHGPSQLPSAFPLPRSANGPGGTKPGEWQGCKTAPAGRIV
jgi:hypothetical protein